MAQLTRPLAALEHQKSELEVWLRGVFTDPDRYESEGLARPSTSIGRLVRWAPGARFEGIVGRAVDQMPPNFFWSLAAAVRCLPPSQRWVLREHLQRGRSFRECDFASQRFETPDIYPACERTWRARYEKGLTTLAGIFWDDDGERLYPRGTG